MGMLSLIFKPADFSKYVKYFSEISLFDHSPNTVLDFISVTPVFNVSFFKSLRVLIILNQTRWKREGLGEASAPHNLLKFADFVSENGCKSQGRRNEDSNSYIFEEATRIYQNVISFDFIPV